MKLPDWINAVLTAFDGKAEPHSEIDIAQALETERAKQNELLEEDVKVYLAEHSFFLLRGVHETSTGIWGRYFGPWVVIESTGFINPDISQLDAETIGRWEDRANAARDPVMIALYA